MPHAMYNLFVNVALPKICGMKLVHKPAERQLELINFLKMECLIFKEAIECDGEGIVL